MGIPKTKVKIHKKNKNSQNLNKKNNQIIFKSHNECFQILFYSIIPWDFTLKLLFLFLWGQMNSKIRSKQNKTTELIPGWNNSFQNIMKRWDFFLRHLSLFCILPFFCRASSVCITWELVQEENNTPNQ